MKKKLFSQKLLLLMVLFFSGCSLFDVVDSVSGGIGRYTANGGTNTFWISDDANSYGDSESCKLLYASRGYDYIIYTGYDENNDLITVHLTELSDTKGVYTKYKGNVMQKIAGFSWVLNTITHKIKGKTGVFSMNDKAYDLCISPDGLTVKDQYYKYSDDNEDYIELQRFGDDWAEYQGWSVDDWITVALIDITDYGGIYRRYEWDTLVEEIGFVWKEK